MKFSKDFLQGFEGETISEEITGQGRWTTYYERIFEYKGKFYKTDYEKGSTESQESSPYEYDDDLIECKEVFPHSVLKTEFRETEQKNPPRHWWITVGSNRKVFDYHPKGDETLGSKLVYVQEIAEVPPRA